MRRNLHEAKSDLELAIVKALSGAPLNLTEVQEIQSLDTRELMVDHDLDYVLAGKILKHAQLEEYRLQAQNQYTPIDDFDLHATSLTRSYPISEGSRLRGLIRKLIDEELRK